MTTTAFRRAIKKEVDRLPAEQLASVADFVEFLNRDTLGRRIREAEKAFKQKKGVNWRGTRSDV
jgi:mRNA-degrading endonuclease RelE of RelBE toxin-antitoxin system